MDYKEKYFKYKKKYLDLKKIIDMNNTNIVHKGGAKTFVLSKITDLTQEQKRTWNKFRLANMNPLEIDSEILRRRGKIARQTQAARARVAAQGAEQTQQQQELRKAIEMSLALGQQQVQGAEQTQQAARARVAAAQQQAARARVAAAQQQEVSTAAQEKVINQFYEKNSKFILDVPIPGENGFLNALLKDKEILNDYLNIITMNNYIILQIIIRILKKNLLDFESWYSNLEKNNSSLYKLAVNVIKFISELDMTIVEDTHITIIILVELFIRCKISNYNETFDLEERLIEYEERFRSIDIPNIAEALDLYDLFDTGIIFYPVQISRGAAGVRDREIYIGLLELHNYFNLTETVPSNRHYAEISQFCKYDYPPYLKAEDEHLISLKKALPIRRFLNQFIDDVLNNFKGMTPDDAVALINDKSSDKFFAIFNFDDEYLKLFKEFLIANKERLTKNLGILLEEFGALHSENIMKKQRSAAAEKVVNEDQQRIRNEEQEGRQTAAAMMAAEPAAAMMAAEPAAAQAAHMGPAAAHGAPMGPAAAHGAPMGLGAMFQGGPPGTGAMHPGLRATAVISPEFFTETRFLITNNMTDEEIISIMVLAFFLNGKNVIITEESVKQRYRNLQPNVSQFMQMIQGMGLMQKITEELEKIQPDEALPENLGIPSMFIDLYDVFRSENIKINRLLAGQPEYFSGLDAQQAKDRARQLLTGERGTAGEAVLGMSMAAAQPGVESRDPELARALELSMAATQPGVESRDKAEELKRLSAKLEELNQAYEESAQVGNVDRAAELLALMESIRSQMSELYNQ